MQDNKIEWDNTLKIVIMGHNTMKHGGIGYSPFQLTFGREPNILAMLNTTHLIKYSNFIPRWKNRHEKYLNKARKSISLQKEKCNKQQDARITKPQETYVSGDLVKFMNQAPSNKLSAGWKGPATILEETGNNNYKIIFDNKTRSIHANQLMPYYI